jgi:hypothetical protein
MFNENQNNDTQALMWPTYDYLAYNFGNGKGKGKIHPITSHEGPEREREMYRSTPSLISALDEVGGHLHALVALPTVKAPYPLYRRLGGPQGQSGLVRKTSPPLGFEPQIVQAVASYYNDWAILTLIVLIKLLVPVWRS